MRDEVAGVRNPAQDQIQYPRADECERNDIRSVWSRAEHGFNTDLTNGAAIDPAGDSVEISAPDLQGVSSLALGIRA